MDMTQKILLAITSVLTIAVQVDAVSVNPALCPTNKIAPHRRAASWEQSKPRTLGLIYSFLTPSRPRPPALNDIDDLQEKPQEDDPDDCGEIEDYDETDLSSITPGAQNNVYYNNREHRYLFGDSYIKPSYYPVPNRPVRPPQRPPTSHKPQRPVHHTTKPPFSSGGIFGSNVYRPQVHNYPSSYIKPVQENTYDNPQAVYRPGLIGGALGHVVGFPPVRPTFSDEQVSSLKKPRSPVRFPESDSYNYNTRRTSVKEPNVPTSIIGSFVDLLFN